jgi:hypothetical protein
MCGEFLSRSLDLHTERKARTMNPNRMMIAKAMVAQTALREEAQESRRRSRKRRAGTSQGDHHFLGLLRRR